MNELITKSSTLTLFALSLTATLSFIPVGLIVLDVFGYKTEEQKSEYSWFIPFNSLIIGFITICLLVYIFFLFHVTNMQLIFNLQIALFILYIRRIWQTGLQALIQIWSWQKDILSFLWTILTLTGLGYFFYMAMMKAALPTLETDSATTYLNASNLFLQHKEIIQVGHFVGDMAKNGFLPLSYGIGLHSGMLAHEIMNIMSCFGLVLLFFFLSFLTSPFTAGFVTLVFLSTNYQIHDVLSQAKFDGITFTLALNLIVLTYFLLKKFSSKWLLITLGLTAGFFGGLSYNNLLSMLVILFIGLFYFSRDQNRNQVFKSAGNVALATILAAAPTYFQNIILTGNPVYPFASFLFRSGLGFNIAEDTYAYQYIREIKDHYALRNLQEIITFPSNLWNENEALNLLQSIGSDRGLVMLWYFAFLYCFFVLVRSIFLRKLPSRFETLTGISFFCLYLFWLNTQHILRYFVAAFPLILISSSWFIEKLKGRLSFFAQSVASIDLMLILSFYLYCFWSPYINFKNALSAALSQNITILEYVQQNYYRYSGQPSFGPAMSLIREKAKPGDKILSFITGHYYFGTEFKTFSGNGSNTLPSKWGIPQSLSKFKNGDEFKEELIRRGFKWVVFNPAYAYFSPAEKPVMDSFFASLVPYASAGPTKIYKISPQ